MNFLILQHLDIETPALIAELLEQAGHTLTTIHLDQGEQLPSAADFDGVIMMGGPQSANDDSDYIHHELNWIKKALAADIPMLGICLGAQIIAKAAGAEIYPSPVRELGWYPLYQTLSSENDPLFEAMPDGLVIFQWHGESFSLSDKMTLVATHPDVPAQAFRIGRAQYGLQFHIEVNESIIEAWIAAGESERNHLGVEGISQLQKDSLLYLEPMREFCSQIIQRWLNEITAQTKKEAPQGTSS